MFLNVTLLLLLLLFLVLIIIFLLLPRFKGAMAALVAWIVGSVTGGRSKEDEPNTDPKTAEQSSSKQAKNKNRSVKKPKSKEPTFSSSLQQPIEEVIEETLAEEQAALKIRKRAKKSKTERIKPPEEDEIGYSFFKPPTRDLPAKTENTVPKSKLLLEQHSPPLDDVGFSFIPAKDKKKRPPVREKQQEKVKEVKKPEKPRTTDISNYSRPSILLVSHSDSKEEFVFVDKKPAKVDGKESKKVQSSISYASIVKNEEISEENRIEPDLHLYDNYYGTPEKDEQEKVSFEEIESIEEQPQTVIEEEEEEEPPPIHKSPSFVVEDKENETSETIEEAATDAIKQEEDREEQEDKKCENLEILSNKQITNGEVDEDLLDSIVSKKTNLEENREESESTLLNLINSNKDSNNYFIKGDNYQSNYYTQNSEVNEATKTTEEKEEVLGLNEAVDEAAVKGDTQNIRDINEEDVPTPGTEEKAFDVNEEFLNTERLNVKESTTVKEELREVKEEKPEEREENNLIYFDQEEESDSTSEVLDGGEEEEEQEEVEEVLINFEQEESKDEESESISVVLDEEYYDNGETEEQKEEIDNFVDDTDKQQILVNYLRNEFEETQENQFISTQEAVTNFLHEEISAAVEDKDQDVLIEEAVEYFVSESLEESADKPATPIPSVEEAEFFQEESAKIEKALLESVVNSIKKGIFSVGEEINEEVPKKMSSGQQVRVLTLNDQEHQDTVLYRLQKNWVIQFRLGPSLLGRKVLLYCNYPKNGDFQRHVYHQLNWRQDEGCQHADDTALLTEIRLEIAGSFHYYFTYEDAETSDHQGSGFFLVDPVLAYGNNEELPLDCIQCQTVLAKSLGPFEGWENKLRVAKESGYNVIHFTPIQQLGASNSSYSLAEQLQVNSLFGKGVTFKNIENLVAKMRKEWKIVSICDIVLNHTANESHWLQEHPEATYNCQNCPYMRPAYLLDAALHQFTIDVQKGVYENVGIPPSDVNNEEHLNSIRYHLQTIVLPKINIPELFMCDVNKYVVNFLNRARTGNPQKEQRGKVEGELSLIQDPEFRRLRAEVDMELALKLYNVYRSDCFDEETRLKKCGEVFKKKLDALNAKVAEEVNAHLNAAVENCIAGIRYFRVQHDGPKIKEISVKEPLVSRYFTDYGKPLSIDEHEKIVYSDNSKYLMAHNGWVMNADPLQNFASSSSNVYLRRELIAWGDSVKLRFGDKPEDSPFLWNHMRQYVEQTARIFDGVRLDNCHSTPIPVAEYLLDCARKIRPNLYVVAELFTNSDNTDNIFVNRLGISSLIREAMSAWDSHEQGRLVYRYGGVPVGSFYQPKLRPLVPSIAHALFLDLTHDNPSPVEKRSVFDLLPSTALVNMACCGSGSNRGYDELVPHHIHVVDEDREYTEWTDDENLAVGNLRFVTRKSGIIAAKKALNELHFELGRKGFDQVYVDQMDPDIVAVTRHNPETHQSCILVSFTAFGHPPENAAHYQRGIKPLRVEGVLDEIVLEATLSHIAEKSSGSKYQKFEDFTRDTKYINGVSEYQVQVKQHIQIQESDIFEIVNSGTPNTIQLNFKNFKPGSIAVIKVSLPEDVRDSVRNVRNLIHQFSLNKETELWRIISAMGLPDLNRALYRCDQEERDEGFGFGTYNIPSFGPLVYSGLQGFMSLLSVIRPSNDLGHPMCANLRDGNWMIDYIWQRLKLDEGTKNLGQWIEENTKSLKTIPRYLIPCYFDLIITGVYALLLEHSFNSMSGFVCNGSTFVKALSLGSLQFAAYIKSADLPVLSPNLAPPKPPKRKNDKGELVQSCVTLSAGLPHFSVGYMRNWGRDTFIALRGLFLLTGRYEDARYHILGYAECLRHGLIPNLLDGGRNARYNCRDAIWWWAYCIKCYTEEVPNGIKILSDKVSRIYPTDDSPALPPGEVEQTLADVIQEALNIHFQGLVFRERNAGRQIDEQMTEKGFNNQIGVHPETGFVFGGNDANCGTWMDKMGSSAKAGNKGKPATPRDGSAVELIGLSKAVISWLARLNRDGLYKYEGVERVHKNSTKTKWTFIEWAQKIQENFENYFWINPIQTDGELRPDLINKRGIYKDSHGATQTWADYQLRCNFPIAMVAAPELFQAQNAWIALENAEKYLLGPLGMRTLDPEDWNYNGNYDNADDSHNHNTANGFNYHQGPEWVWPIGFYLRAKLIFAAQNNQLAKVTSEVKLVLSRHFVELQTSPWRGLPELTNKDGAYCRDSSRTQAWSMSCVLEVLNDLQKIETGN